MLIKRIILFIIVLLLAFNFVQTRYDLVSLKPLDGAYTPTPEPAFTCSAWMTGEFQAQYQRCLEDSVAFRPVLARIYNQADYSLFAVPHVQRVVIGKQHELFGAEYITGYLGSNFPGEHFIDEKIKMLKFVQDFLWEQKRIFVVVIIPPDKGSIYPDRIPDRYLKLKRHQTGREYFTKKAKDAGINMVDFNPWFIAMKDTARYRLIPSTGVHWSDWGSFLAADSAVRYLESKTGLRMPRLVLDSIVTTMIPRHKDDDINRAMNLIWDAPHEMLAYPKFHVAYDSETPKPAALFVADSFIWGWWDQPIIQNLFRNQEIWYYDKEVFPECFTRAKYTWEINLKEAIERQNMLILLHVGAGSGDPGSGVIDRLYAEYDTSADNPIRKNERIILADTAKLWWQKSKSQEYKVPLAEIVRRDAIFMFNTELRKKK